MKGKHTVVAWQNLSKGKVQENIFYKYKRRQIQIAPAGSPYQKEDSLYDEDDYDGEDAAGQLQKMSMLSLRDFI